MDSTIEVKLDALREKYGTWTAVAQALGVSKQYLYWCIKQDKAPYKLLEALNLEVRYVKAKS